MTPPNAISLVRALLVPVVMALILADFSGHARWAAALYVVAAVSDSLDGYLARSRDWISVVGAFLDPLADKLLVVGALVALVQADRVSAWVTMAIIAREFAISGLRMVAASGAQVISASQAGKLKTASQNLAILAALLIPSQHVVLNLLWALAVVLSYVSLGAYVMAARHHFSTSAARA